MLSKHAVPTDDHPATQDYPFEGTGAPAPPEGRGPPSTDDDMAIKKQSEAETDGAAVDDGSRSCGQGQRGAGGSSRAVASGGGGGSLAVAVGCVVILSIMKMLSPTALRG